MYKVSIYYALSEHPTASDVFAKMTDALAYASEFAMDENISRIEITLL